ncbi:MAG: 3-hydroxyacyl-CoA dehydrogenase family protein [Thermoplasmata archaeon]|uniref:3-hydroxyacyl-CoA dehydrogenase family protein n=1 Tax=Candidatus Sysuiplasma superficiale TaxID=2823368 RepID=A0A8J8CDA9_9ARCH|nr:3-hydroxyacyl-CoA dehydrogenase family protein [Candidatus Sysuiplasma superficiale]
MLKVRKAGIIGAGTMGSAIADLFAFNGFEVALKDVSDTLVRRGIQNVDRILSGLVAYHSKRAADQIRKIEELGVRLTQEQKDTVMQALRPMYGEREKSEIMSRIHGTTSYDDLGDAEIVIEAAFESLDVKKGIFGELERTVGESAILASNTSSISITAIAASVTRRERVIGMHFFNPPYTLPLVEVIPGMETSEQVVSDVIGFLLTMRNHRTSMVPVRVKESPGFLVNRLLVPMLNEACFLLEEGIASAGDIDTAMKSGAGLPMGPLELADMVGIDISYNVARVLYEEFADSKYRPSPLLRRMVDAGRLGRKTGRGFFDYSKKT